MEAELYTVYIMNIPVHGQNTWPQKTLFPFSKIRLIMILKTQKQILKQIRTGLEKHPVKIASVETYFSPVNCGLCVWNKQ